MKNRLALIWVKKLVQFGRTFLGENILLNLVRLTPPKRNSAPTATTTREKIRMFLNIFSSTCCSFGNRHGKKENNKSADPSVSWVSWVSWLREVECNYAALQTWVPFFVFF
jgi:hypothetical protein